jgi:hypothetical protein
MVGIKRIFIPTLWHDKIYERLETLEACCVWVIVPRPENFQVRRRFFIHHTCEVQLSMCNVAHRWRQFNILKSTILVPTISFRINRQTEITQEEEKVSCSLNYVLLEAICHITCFWILSILNRDECLIFSTYTKFWFWYLCIGFGWSEIQSVHRTMASSMDHQIMHLLMYKPWNFCVGCTFILTQSSKVL